MNKKQVIEWCKNAMVRDTRDNGENFTKFNDGVFEQIKDTLFSSGFEIKDDNYQQFENALDAIIYHLESNDDLQDFDHYEHISGDIYTGELLRWLMDDISRVEDVNDAISEGHTNLINAIQVAQENSWSSIWQMAINVVNGMLEEDEEDDEE